jgi:hypothetical protein
MAKKYYLETVEFHTNKTWSVLRYFDPTERKRLMKFMASPYFNQSKTMTKLCELLLRLIERGKPGFDRREIWGKLFPDEEYDDVNFRKYCSDLLKLLETFMAQEVVAKDQVRQRVDTLEFIVSHKVEPLYISTFRQVRAEMEKTPYHSLGYYQKRHELEKQYYLMMDFNQNVNQKTNVEAISENLDFYYWIEKIKLYITTLTHKKTGNFEYNLNFITDILQYLAQYPVEDVPELATYYYSFLMLQDEEDTDHYYNFRRLLDRYGGLMPQEESIRLYDSALNYCTGKLNKGNRIFLQEYFDLFDDALRKGVYVVNNEIAIWRFNNIVGAALSLNRLEWAENFIESNKGLIPADTRENTYTFNLARVYRFQGKYEQVLGLLRNVEYEDIGYNLISKMMLTITYYELDAYETLASFLESFRVFLNRQKNLPQQRRKSYLNLIKFVRRLTRIPPGDKAAVAKLREEVIREKASTVNHEWLLEKLAEM